MKSPIDVAQLAGRKLLTRPEAAAYIGISEVTLHYVIHDPHFPALVRVGNGRGRVFIHREKLDQWLDEKAGK